MKPPLPMEQVVQDVPADEPIPWILIMFILFGAAIISWGLTEAIKKTALNKYRFNNRDASANEAKRVLWWTPMLVVASMLIGFGVGCAVGAIEWKTLYGGLVGACGGALASFLVSLFKGNLKTMVSKMTGKKDVEESEDGDV